MRAVERVAPIAATPGVAEPWCWAVLLWIALWLPPVRAWFEVSMFRHMLLQLPLLVAIGWIGGLALQRSTSPLIARSLAVVAYGNRWGATGLLLAIASLTLWMLPRMLDSARLELGWDAAKFLSLTFLGGGIAALSWPRCPAIVRGVLHLEIIATFWRFGWVFLVTEERLCLSYLLGDQQRTGQALLIVGALWAISVVWVPVFGTPHGATRRQPIS